MFVPLNPSVSSQSTLASRGVFQSSSRYGGAASSSLDASQSQQLQQLRQDLKESLERESDVRSQLKFTEEEARVMRRQLRQAAAGLTPADDVHVADDDDNDDIVGGKTSSPGKTASDHQTSTSAQRDKEKEDSELRMQLDSAEYEVS